MSDFNLNQFVLVFKFTVEIWSPLTLDFGLWTLDLDLDLDCDNLLIDVFVNDHPKQVVWGLHIFCQVLFLFVQLETAAGSVSAVVGVYEDITGVFPIIDHVAVFVSDSV